MALSPGTRLGPYEILVPLGAGGMGEVYKARDTRLDRTVAVKVLPSHLSTSAEARQRFEREAKTISQLSHPHICALYDVGHEGETEYLVMELLEGETLSERLAKGPLPLEQTLKFGIEIADALDRAHRQGIVHRDLKPGNVMLTKSGVKLLDFGLAKFATPTSGPISGLSMLPTTPKGSNLTAEGTILGTFQYMAPEQLEGKEADARTDIFALGAVLYEMATGKKAFSGTSQASLISSIMSSEPAPISALQPLAPPAIDRVVKTCLAKDPEDRWQAAGDIAKELRWILDGSSASSSAAPGVNAPSQRRERIAWFIAAAAIVALAAALALLRRPTPVGFSTVSSLQPPAKVNFETTGDNCGSLTLSPDGRQITFAANGPDGKVMLWLRAIDSLAAHPIAGTEDATFPFWSPDSRSVAFFAHGKLWRVDLSGAPPLAICDALNGRSGSWNREGVIVFSPATNSEIFRVSASGGSPTPVTKLDASINETTHRWPTFLPDGKRFLYMAGSHSEGTKSESNAIYLAALDSPQRTRVMQTHSNVAYAPGFLLFVRNHVLMAQSFEAASARLTGEPRPVAYGVQGAASYFRGDFSVSDNGMLVYAAGTSDTGARLRWFDSHTGKPMGEPFGEAAEYRQLAVSPDGSHIAAAVADASTGLPEIWLIDARGVRTRFTFGAPAFSPIFSPDGTRLAYAKGSGIYVKPTAGGTEEKVFASNAQIGVTDWSRDGRYLAFDSAAAGSPTKSDLWILPFFGDRKAKPFLATPANESAGFFSPNGRWICYASDESGRPELYVADFPGLREKWQVSPAGTVGGQWNSNREIGFGSLDGNAMSVEIKETPGGLEFGAPKVTFKLPPNIDTNPATAWDGTRYLWATHTENSELSQVVLMSNWTAALARR